MHGEDKGRGKGTRQDKGKLVWKKGVEKERLEEEKYLRRKVEESMGDQRA